MSDKPLVSAPQTRGRVQKDIQRAQDNEIKNQGIWYVPDEANINRGWALIRGPEGTPYEGCLLVFLILFPSDYPFSPPKVSFQTSDGKTRFHPNLYVDGKVCLSILGTYSGPSWSGTQSLSSVLLSILGLLDDNPLTHEPAYERGSLLDPKHRDYADCVEHNMVKLMLETIASFERDPNVKHHLWSPFKDIIPGILEECKKMLRKKIEERAKQPERQWANLTYSMQFRSYWKKLSVDGAAAGAGAGATA